MMITEKFINMLEVDAFVASIKNNNPGYRVEYLVTDTGWDIDYPVSVTVTIDKESV